MSSFRKNPNAKTYKCVYCAEGYAPRSQPNNGVRCPRCHLWQPAAPMTIVTQSSRFTPKQINRIFVISLEKDRERWGLFLQRLNNKFCNLERRQVNRFIAVNGADPDYVSVVLDTVYENEEKTKEKALQFYQQHPGSIGCYLSHLTLWQVLLQSQTPNEKYVLIMEDDAFFTPYALQNLEIALAQAQKQNWDIMYVGHNHLRGAKTHPLFLKPLPTERRQGYNTGFFGYVVKLSSLPKVINIVKRFDTSFVDLSVRQNFGDRDDQIAALFINTSLIQHNKKYTSSRRIFDAQYRKS